MTLACLCGHSLEDEHIWFKTYKQKVFEIGCKKCTKCAWHWSNPDIHKSKRY